jgi:hypothetical protein
MIAHRMNYGIVLAAAALLLLAIMLYLFRVELLEAGIGFFGLRFAAHRAGLLRPRRRGNFAANVKALALLYAAWNTRWLKPTTLRASVPAKAAQENRPPALDGFGADFGEFPAGF